MMFCVLPLIPLVWMGIGALIGGGGTVITVNIIEKFQARPPYDEPVKAYANYVRAVEKSEYERYQWAVSNPMALDEFTMRCNLRKEKNLTKTTEGLGDALGKKEGPRRAKALSPWDRKEKTFVFIKEGDSWKVIDALEEN